MIFYSHDPRFQAPGFALDSSCGSWMASWEHWSLGEKNRAEQPVASDVGGKVGENWVNLMVYVYM